MPSQDSLRLQVLFLSYFNLHVCIFQINGCDISWLHLVDLYKRHCGVKCSTPGLSIVHKLILEHIQLTSYSKMHVDLAVQVCLSSSV